MKVNELIIYAIGFLFGFSLNMILKKLFKKQNSKYLTSEKEVVDYFENWEIQERKRKEYQVKQGVKSLREGRPVMVSNLNGSGLELAIAVKKQLIFEETQKLNKCIHIDGLNEIKINFKNK